MTEQGLEVRATCGIAKLLAVTLGEPLNDIYPRVGLELCPQCHSASKDPKTYPFCSRKHYNKYNRAALAVPLICDECDIFFVRKEVEVMGWARRGGKNIYCSKVCYGKWFGRTHGVGTPNNSAREGVKVKGLSTHCKWDTNTHLRTLTDTPRAGNVKPVIGRVQ